MTDRAPDRDFVFNIVWTGIVFPYLSHLVATQLAQSDARFRFVLNACAPDQIGLMEAFAEAHPGRVVEMIVVSDDAMITHGAALDRILTTRDDGEFFCLVDSDIAASGPYVADFADRLAAGAAGITSGRGIWSESDVIPEGHAGVNGEYFYGPDGYLFGSPHFAMYRRDALLEVRERWDIGFGSGAGLSDEALAVLAAAGQNYWLYDTGKLLNVFLQESGHRLEHREHASLLHIGGMSHYLSPPETVGQGGLMDLGTVDRENWNPARLEVAEFSAAVLKAAVHHEPVPEVPAGLDPDTTAKLTLVRTTILDAVG
ncbi:MAG: hypothetical protein R8F63_16590 [Acidimicrobiales bacterium]|nr:hypothetical protein [Acidimicrobiales bacterium]